MITRISLISAFMFCSLLAFAQRPKLDLKVYAGYHTHIFVYKEIQKSKDVLSGWQAGFGFRVTYRKIFGEIDFNFVRSRVIIPVDDSLMLDVDEILVKLNSFEFPMKVGVIPIKTGFFKWYLYSGLAVRINTKAKFKVGDIEESLKPKELGLTNPNLDFLFGTQFDIGAVNLELMYSFGINSSLTENIRVNSHELQLNFGIWF
jgi:hypothetical protein